MLSAIGAAASVVKMSDSTVADGQAAGGGAMEIKAATVDVERCTLTRLQARSALATECRATTCTTVFSPPPPFDLNAGE